MINMQKRVAQYLNTYTILNRCRLGMEGGELKFWSLLDAGKRATVLSFFVNFGVFSSYNLIGQCYHTHWGTIWGLPYHGKKGGHKGYQITSYMYKLQFNFFKFSFIHFHICAQQVSCFNLSLFVAMPRTHVRFINSINSHMYTVTV